MDEKKRLIKDNISEEECSYMCDDEPFNCVSCSCLEECCMKAEIRCDSDFAASINYGGYDTEETFWEQI